MKLVTMDLWGTILGKSPSVDEIDEEIAKILNTTVKEYRVFKKSINKKDAHAFISEALKVFKGVTENEHLATAIGLTVLNALYRYNYRPVLVSDSILKVLELLTEGNYEVRIITNSGLMDKHLVKSKLITISPLFEHIEILESRDYVTEKPDLEFYKETTRPHHSEEFTHWLHIGNDMELDIKPCLALGGTGYLIRSAKDWELLHQKLKNHQ